MLELAGAVYAPLAVLEQRDILVLVSSLAIAPFAVLDLVGDLLLVLVRNIVAVAVNCVGDVDSMVFLDVLKLQLLIGGDRLFLAVQRDLFDAVAGVGGDRNGETTAVLDGLAAGGVGRTALAVGDGHCVCFLGEGAGDLNVIVDGFVSSKLTFPAGEDIAVICRSSRSRDLGFAPLGALQDFEGSGLIFIDAAVAADDLVGDGCPLAFVLVALFPRISKYLTIIDISVDTICIRSRVRPAACGVIAGEGGCADHAGGGRVGSSAVDGPRFALFQREPFHNGVFCTVAPGAAFNLEGELDLVLVRRAVRIFAVCAAALDILFIVDVQDVLVNILDERH